MPNSPSPPNVRRVAIVGGGISGLAAAHRLREIEPNAHVSLFEASRRLGGVLQTERKEGYLIERSADMFTTKEPWALELCRRIGFEGELIETNKRNRRAFIVKQGKLIPVPAGFTLMAPMRVWPMVQTPLLSLPGKVRMGWEYFTPAKTDETDESLAQFATRRFGREAYDWLVQPLIGGIYTADPEKLSMAATMRQFVEMERQHGGLIRGMRRAKHEAPEDGKQSGARYNRFLAPRDGLGSLVEALAARLPTGCVKLNSGVERLARNPADNTWEVTLSASPGARTFDDLILACGAPRAARLLKDVAPELSADLGRIPHAGVAMALLGYRLEQISHPLDGFGFVVPIAERRRILAASFASLKFPGRSPDGQVLLRVFVGGACQPELLELSDDTILSLVRKELTELIGANGEPVYCELARWREAMPQYHVGHVELVRQIDKRLADIPRFALAGNSLHGVGIPFCVQSGEQAAECIATRSSQSVAEHPSLESA